MLNEQTQVNKNLALTVEELLFSIPEKDLEQAWEYLKAQPQTPQITVCFLLLDAAMEVKERFQVQKVDMFGTVDLADERRVTVSAVIPVKPQYDKSLF